MYIGNIALFVDWLSDLSCWTQQAALNVDVRDGKGWGQLLELKWRREFLLESEVFTKISVSKA